MSVHPFPAILTAFFDSRSEAESAVNRLVAAGSARDEITVVEGADAASAPRRKGFFDRLAPLSLPHEDRHSYAEGLRRGGYVLAVPTHAANLDRLRALLDGQGAVDMAAREQAWRREGWAGTEAEYDRLSADVAPRADRAALFDRAPCPGPSGTGPELTVARLRLARRSDGPAETRTRAYIFDDLVGKELGQDDLGDRNIPAPWDPFAVEIERDPAAEDPRTVDRRA